MEGSLEYQANLYKNKPKGNSEEAKVFRKE